MICILREHDLVILVVNKIFPAFSRNLFLHQPAPPVVFVAIDIIVKIGICSEFRETCCGDSWWDYIPKVAKIIVYVVRIQRFGLALPDTFEYNPVFKIFIFIHRPATRCCINCVLIP
ncbi:hypothetical protein D3C72_1201530 [compost metagenome]